MESPGGLALRDAPQRDRGLGCKNRRGLYKWATALQGRPDDLWRDPAVAPGWEFRIRARE